MKLEDYKNAGDLALETSPSIKHFVYAYHDKDLDNYNPPFVTDKEPAVMVDGLKNSVLKGVAKPETMAGLELTFIGTFDLSTGKTEVFDKPAVIASLDVLFEKLGGVPDGKVQ